jgi:hypothetical protein
MGYRIVYPGVKRKRNPIRQKRIIARMLIFLLSLLLLFPVAVPPGKQVLTKLMLPKETAVSAMEDAIRNMREGENLENALAAFCEAVIPFEK